MFNFYVVLVGHDIVTDTGMATTRGCKFKAPWLETKSTINEGNLKTWVLTENNLKIPDENKNISSLTQTTPWIIWPLLTRINDGPCNQEEKNCRKIEKNHSV